MGTVTHIEPSRNCPAASHLRCNGGGAVHQSPMRTFCCVIIITLFFTCAPAQELMSRSQPDAALPGTTSLTIHRLVPEVQMVISAQDHRHRPVVDLQEAEIAVFDNGIAVPITSFESRASLPLRIALLLDASESMHPGFAAERRTGLNSLRRLHGSRGDQVFAITFAAGQMPFLAYAQTEAPKASPPLQAGGQTALYDSLIAAARKLASATPTRRVLLLFSDGEDNYSRATLGEAIAALQQWQIAVYSISVHSSRWEYPGD